MARSNLLKDLVNGSVNIENILLRLKVILSDLDNEAIMKWVNGELQGYKNIEDVPEYRIFKGNPTGTFVVNYQVQYTNAAVPIHSLLDSDEIDKLVTIKISDSIAVIQTILNGENRDNYGRVISTSYCHAISVERLQIASMKIRLPANQLDGVVSFVKSKLVEVIMELEKQFANLDDLDIKTQIEDDKQKKEKVIYNIGKIIYEGSIEIGDKNKIGKSRFGHLFGGKE
ncbi:hypothetical protein QUF95_17425 [Paenibacillus silvae]|uniref:AbiTii domain-containing protein n=1 Tax=Paenibacillus silvae TaxID=1325358 RepID=UPI0025A12995|nr:hypothetical protein [Paenibacillus silvae]MDM5279183.1 hypothetical protein [Paenibacillus silvae]